MRTVQPASDDPAAGEGNFEPFDLTVNLGPDAVPWLSASSRAGSVHGIPRRVTSLPQLPDLLDHVYDYTDAVRFAELQPEPELSRILGELVFGDPLVLQLLQATRGVAAERGRQVLFRILAAPHLAVLPWELLPDPAAAQGRHGHRYLALAPDTHLVRLARGRTYSARTTLLEAPLNLLLVLSSPTPRDASEDWLAFDIFEIKRALLAELAPLVEAGMLNIDVEDRPTLDNLRRRIGAQRRGYHLFHYVGHALPDRLILEDRAGQRKDLDSSQFVEVLRLCPDLRLAVFAGCETARAAGDPATFDPRQAGWRDLLSLADYCVQEACPVVIGMQAVLPFSTERVLTRFFYQALANGYSTAEALRLARGAIQGDERLGGDLLDWSVPALFVGSSEPGPLLPRSAVTTRSAAPVRSDLKLGLRQSNERFFGRELPLRQAVDIMGGVAPERVLVVTGPARVGKTELVDRTIEELGAAVTHVLYVPLDRLAPEVVRAAGKLDAGSLPDIEELTKLAPDQALDQLCRLVTELLRDQVTRARDPNLGVVEWWERLVQDLVQCQFVLAIDDVGVLDYAQRGLLERLIERWLVDEVNADLKAMPGDQLLDDRQRLLAQLQDSQEQGGDSQQPAPEPLASVLAKLDRYLDGLPDRLLAESRQVLFDSLERLVVKLSYQVTLGAVGSGGGSLAPLPTAFEPVKVVAALKQLEQARQLLGKALQILAERRSPVRIAITATEKPRQFLDLPDEQVFEMRLAPFTWPETWRWIRRNLPGLLSYGEAYLCQLWSRLGPRLDWWEELERRVLQARDGPADLQKLANKIAPPSLARPARPQAAPARRGERALQIAVAGPNLAGPRELADAITRLAIEHGIGGRVVLGANEAGALATLIDVPSPFTGQTQMKWDDILDWLRQVHARQPDIILLDYGGELTRAQFDKAGSATPDRSLLRSLCYGSLLIAAGGNRTSASSLVTIPSAYPEVLGVGPLDNEGQLRPYAEWSPDLRKPDLFMPDDFATSALAAALRPDLALFHKQHGTWGSSFAALHAVATATLVWSILPELSPRAVRQLLIAASKEIAKAKPARSLTMADAVSLARQRAVERRLREGPASLQTLGAMTGLDAQVLAAMLDSMTNVIKLTSGRLERYQYVR